MDFGKKWTEEKIDWIRDYLGDLVISSERKALIKNIKKFGEETDLGWELGDIEIKEEWVGDKIVFEDIFVLKPTNEGDEYILSLRFTSEVPYWAIISHNRGDKWIFDEYYNTFEEVVEAIDKIKAGELPYTIVARFYFR